jgi:hypothetical protein
MKKVPNGGGNNGGTGAGNTQVGEKTIENGNRSIYYYKGTLSFGDIKFGSDQDPAYLFVTVKVGTDDATSTYYATGIFKNIPKTLDLRLPDNTDFNVNVKVIKEGGSFGIYRELIGNFIMIDNSAASDSLSYQFPYPVRADAGACSVYTKADSSQHAFEQYPQIDTYFGQFVFNTGHDTDTLKVNLNRMVWGLKCRIHNFKKGSIRLIVGDLQPPSDTDGPSEQVINFPDSVGLFMHALAFFPVYPHIDDAPRLRVIYNNSTQDQTIFDEVINIYELKKKILDIDLSRLGSNPITIKPDSILTDREINEIK